MNIHEYQALELFRDYGIPAHSGKIARNLEEALGLARETGYPVVLKAQVLTGGRGKAGGVKLAAENRDSDHLSRK